MARDNKIVTQMGNQGASNPDQLQIQKWINNKVIGTITGSMFGLTDPFGHPE